MADVLTISAVADGLSRIVIPETYIVVPGANVCVSASSTEPDGVKVKPPMATAGPVDSFGAIVCTALPTTLPPGDDSVVCVDVVIGLAIVIMRGEKISCNVVDVGIKSETGLSTPMLAACGLTTPAPVG